MPDDRDRYYQMRATDMQRRADMLRRGAELIEAELNEKLNDSPCHALGSVRMLLTIDALLHPAEET